MNIWRRRYSQWLFKTLLILLGLVLLKVFEMVVLQGILRMYLGLAVNMKEEMVDIIVLVVIMSPYTFIVLRQRKTMKEAEDKYKVLAEDSLIGIYTVTDEKIIYANQQFMDMVGYARDELIGKNVFDLIHPEDRNRVLGSIKRKLRDEEKDAHFEIRGVKKDKTVIDVEIYGTIVERQGIPQIIGSILDITERKRNENLLKELAFTDPLTGLYNRRYFEKHFNGLVHNLTRKSSSILFMDLDDFKPVNDSLGHEIGDQLLKEVANLFLSCTRKNDIVSRLGGDEFIVFLPDIDKNETIHIASRILEDIRKPFVINNQQICVSISVGIAVYPYDGISIDTLIKKADKEMYQAKMNGKNTYCFETEIPLESPIF